MDIIELSDSRFPEFFELVKVMVAESEFKEAKPDFAAIWRLYKNENVNVFLAIDQNKVIGFISGLITTYFFSKKMRVTDLGFYITEQYRGSRAAIKLIKALEVWAKQNNITDVCLGQTTAVNIEKTQQFYNRLGYKTVGFNTVKHLE
jgi:GNAT superfamily N-acetyltransferase